MINRSRTTIGALVLSASALVGIALHEGYSDEAIIPVPGDVPTIGFGTTQGVKPGDRITPPKALKRALSDIQKYEGAIKQCVKVPLYQYEYDAYTSLAYNIGPTAFCKSSIVTALNAEQYDEACKKILMFDKFKGKPLKGLTIRRQAEYKQCIGEPT